MATLQYLFLEEFSRAGAWPSERSSSQGPKELHTAEAIQHTCLHANLSKKDRL